MAGDFAAEIHALAPRLRAYAMALTRSSADADDLVQETLMRAWRSRERFEPGTNLKAWLHMILRNAFYTQAHKTRGTVQDVDGRLAGQLTSQPDQEWRLRYA